MNKCIRVWSFRQVAFLDHFSSNPSFGQLSVTFRQFFSWYIKRILVLRKMKRFCFRYNIRKKKFRSSNTSTCLNWNRNLFYQEGGKSSNRTTKSADSLYWSENGKSSKTMKKILFRKNLKNQNCLGPHKLQICLFLETHKNLSKMSFFESLNQSQSADFVGPFENFYPHPR